MHQVGSLFALIAGKCTKSSVQGSALTRLGAVGVPQAGCGHAFCYIPVRIFEAAWARIACKTPLESNPQKASR